MAGNWTCFSSHWVKHMISSLSVIRMYFFSFHLILYFLSILWALGWTWHMSFLWYLSCTHHMLESSVRITTIGESVTESGLWVVTHRWLTVTKYQPTDNVTHSVYCKSFDVFVYCNMFKYMTMYTSSELTDRDKKVYNKWFSVLLRKMSDKVNCF